MSEQQSSEPKSIVVIGAGIVGIGAALYLQRDGHKVTVLDPRGVGEAASFGNAGTIALTSCVPTARPDILRRVPKMLMDPTGPLSIRWSYLPQLTPWLIDLIRNSTAEKIRANAQAKTDLLNLALAPYNELIAEAEAESMVYRNGILQVYESDVSFNNSARERELMQACGHKIDILPGEEIRQMEPAFGIDFKHAVYIENHAMIRHPGDLTKRFAGLFEQKGGTFQQEQVTGLGKDGATWSVSTDKGSHAADRVIVAAGAWSRQIARMLGKRMLLDAERGYHVMLPQPEPTLRRPVLLGDHSVFLLPMEHGLRVTSGVEFGGVELPPDYRRIRAMIPFAKRVLPQLDPREMSNWMGFRPSTPDTRPILGEMTGADGVYFASGGSHVGMTLGPVMGRITADLVAGRDPGIDLDPYRPDRW